MFDAFIYVPADTKIGKVIKHRTGRMEVVFLTDEVSYSGRVKAGVRYVD